MGRNEDTKSCPMVLSAKEAQVIRYLRELQYGELHVFVKEGNPFRVEEIRRSIMLE